MNTETTTKKEVESQAREPRGGKAFAKNPRRPSRRRGRPRSELIHRVIDIRRVARVVAGGRRFTFSVTVVAGNKKGSVGVGVGKAGDTALAIDKALRDAEKNAVHLSFTKEGSIPHGVETKYASSRVMLFPVRGSSGITAGGAVRTVLELSGARGVGAKILSRSKNRINNARAAVAALRMLPGTKARAYVETFENGAEGRPRKSQGARRSSK